MVEHYYNDGGDGDRGTDDPLPVARYELPDEGGCPYLDVDRGFAHRDALVLQGLARHWNSETHTHDEVLLASFEGVDVELPSGDAVLGDTLLLVAVGRDLERVTLESDCHQRRSRDVF